MAVFCITIARQMNNVGRPRAEWKLTNYKWRIVLLNQLELMSGRVAPERNRFKFESEPRDGGQSC